MRLAALISHPIQYMTPLFRRVAEQRGVDLTVYFCSRLGLDERLDAEFGRVFKWDIPLLEGYRSQFLPGVQADIGMAGFARPFNPGILREVRRGRYDALWIHGHYSATNWLAMLAARSVGTKVLVRSESTLDSQRPRRGTEAVRRLAMRAIFRLVDGFLYIGQRNRRYYQAYDVPDERLFFAPYVVDNEFFQAAKRRLDPERAAIRASFGVADHRPVIVYVGKLRAGKQPGLLLDAFAEVRRRFECALLLVGDGELRSELEREVARRTIPDVHCAGFLNQSEVVRAYAAADLVVLPSASETWGLVVNEAMNFALPVVVSDAAGCADDLVRHGENGYVFSRSSPDELATCLFDLVSDKARCETFGQNSLELINGWGLEQCAEGIVKAAQAVSAARRWQVGGTQPA